MLALPPRFSRLPVAFEPADGYFGEYRIDIRCHADSAGAFRGNECGPRMAEAVENDVSRITA